MNAKHMVLAVLIGGFSFVSSARAERPLVITTLPFDDAAAQRGVFANLSDHLSKTLDREVRFVAGKSYSDTIAKLGKGEADVGFMGAAAYVEARRTGQVRAILRTIRKGRTAYHGVILVKKDGGVATMMQLKGKKVAFVDRHSGTGYLYPRLLLRTAGLDPDVDITTVFAGGHHKVVRMVAAGEVDAGACFEGAEEALDDPTVLTAIGRTEPSPGDPVVVRPGLGIELIKQLRSALMEMSSVPDARAFFTFSEIDGFMPALDSDYDVIAELIRKNK